MIPRDIASLSYRVLRYAFITIGEICLAAVVLLIFLDSPARLYFNRLVARAWQTALAALSQTNLSFVAYSIAGPIIGFIILFVLLRSSGPQQDAVEQLRESMLGAAVGLTVPLVIMATVFVWNVPRAIYNDHLALIAENGTLKQIRTKS